MTEQPMHHEAAITESQAAISSKLVAARLAAKGLQQFPGSVPASLSDAYGIQSNSIRIWPGQLAGWKVAGVSAEFQALCGADRVAGPIFAASVIRAQPKRKSVCPVFEGGFAAVEAEIVLELATAIAPTSEVPDDQQLIKAIKEAYVGAEMAGSPVATLHDLGLFAIVSDFGNNNGLVIGEAVPDWASTLQQPITVATTIDDVVVGQGTVESVLGRPLAALRFLVGLCGERRITLAAGTFISTGAITGAHRIAPENRCQVEFSGFSPLEFQFEYKRIATGALKS